MMLTDRELLEAAAKAAGLECRCDPEGCFLIDSDGHGPVFTDWDPLTDDGDALRLAVKLKLEIAPGDGCAFAHDGVPPTVCIREDGEDVGAATRRAIVRAAASMASPDRLGA